MLEIRPISVDIYHIGNKLLREDCELCHETVPEEKAEVFGVYEGEPGYFEWLCDCKDKGTAELVSKAVQFWRLKKGGYHGRSKN